MEEHEQYLENLLDAVRCLSGSNFKDSIRTYKRVALWLEKEGWLEEVKHHKGANTMSKVKFYYEGKHFKLLCDVYEAGSDDGYSQGIQQGYY